MNNPNAFAEADAEFSAAWDKPDNTRFTLPAVDVNAVLRGRYPASHPFQMTRTQLWDMEVKKAWDPKSYIPYVVSEGSSWGRSALADGTERFYRASMQAGWIVESATRVLEEVFIDHPARRILFMGRAAFTTETGADIVAGTIQPLFHVEHGAGGTEENPLNIWRIVFLTPCADPRLMAPFQRMADAGMLPGFLEIYIARDLGVKLTS